MGHDDHDHGHDHDHDHGHDNEQAQAHAHDNEHGHGDGDGGRGDRKPLEAGVGAGRVLFLDAPSGLAGDMIIAALVDLGVPETVVANAVGALPMSGFHLHFGSRVRSGIVATWFDVHVDVKQPTRTYGSIRAVLDEAPLDDGVRARAQRTFRRLAEAEAKVHRSAIDDVHFHEVGAVDAIVDIVGSAAALAHLGAELVVSPLPMGRGFVKAAHGVLPLPAPATVECLAGLATYDGGVDFEFVTPTGAAIVGAHARGSSRWPTMSPLHVGWGSGTADLADWPNLLRAVLGERPSAEQGTHTVLEANIDDATGELVGACIEALMHEGALDAWATPITMKKGRPAFTLAAIVPTERANVLAATMLRETTSLGVRRYEVSRVERPRRIVEVTTAFGVIPLKIAEGPFGPPQIKPEFDACAAAARAHGVPVREVIRAALEAGAAIAK